MPHYQGHTLTNSQSYTQDYGEPSPDVVGSTVGAQVLPSDYMPEDIPINTERPVEVNEYEDTSDYPEAFWWYEEDGVEPPPSTRNPQYMNLLIPLILWKMIG